MLIAAEQAMLNMAFKGATVLDPKGFDITDSLVNQAERINAEFDEMLAKKRRGEAIVAPKKINFPKPGPAKKAPAVTPKGVTEDEDERKGSHKRGPRKATAKAGPPRAKQ